ncbi:hypothetical protein [Mycolicibacter heraklionensis]|uniref:hypothetical protein n=1 Tax=Mycolicibacter heraklionensis TaxID=512402 RepID=UPI0010388696|nr:hypothetical protein [Mycolicibacter heraklionensis]
MHRTVPAKTPPFNSPQTKAFGEAIVDEVLAQVAFALASVDVLGMKPFAFLQQYGEEMEAKAQAALAAAEGAQTTAANAQTTADDAQTAAGEAQTAAEKASTDLQTLIDDGLAAMGLSQTGDAADFTHALNVFIGDLFGPGAVVGTNTSNIQHSALPSSYDNIHVDLQNLFNDVVFADGRGWEDIGPDVQQLAVDMIGPGATVTVNAPSQIPHTVVSSTSGNASLGDDVAGAVASAATATGTASAAASTADDAHAAATGAQQTANTVTTAANNLINGIGGFFGASPQTVADIEAGVDPVIDGLSTFFTNLFNPGAASTPNPATSTQIAVQTVPDLTTPGSENASGVPAIATNAATASASAQAVADGIHQAVYGGNATGVVPDTAAVVQALQKIPQQNIVVNTAAGSDAAITFDAAASAGASTGSYTGTTKTITWSHTVSAAANYLLIGAIFDNPENVAIARFSATAVSSDGLVNVPVLQFSSPNDVVGVLLGAFVNPGTYTVSLTVETETSATWNGFAATSVSYCDVNSVGVGGFNHGGQSTASLSLTTGQTVDDPRSLSVALFVNRAASSTAAALSSMTGATQRTTKAWASTHGLAVAIGDVAASSANNTFGMTAASGSGNSWVVLEILLQAPDTEVGSFGRLIRESTTPVTLTAFGADSNGVPPLPANTFDNVQSLTPDLSAPNMNCFKVSLAGAYWVRGRYEPTAADAGSTTINSDGSIDGTMFTANMYVVVNGIIRTYAAGVTTAAGLEYQTVVDLKPGDTVAVIPGGSLTSYHTTAPAPPTYTGTTTLGTPGSWQIIGDSKWFTVMEIALANRSLL